MTPSLRAGLPALTILAVLTGWAAAQETAAPAAPAQNQVGQKFELPRVGNKDTQIELITGLCGVQMKQMTPMACQCLAEQALSALSDPQRDYLIATVVAPPVADRMLADGRVGQPDQQTIFMFVNATSEACASGTFDAAKAKALTPVLPLPAAKAAPAAPAPAN